WAEEVKADLSRVNPNGGAIALGHPLGATGCVLATKAIHELLRTGGHYGLVTMCCGGGAWYRHPARGHQLTETSMRRRPRPVRVAPLSVPKDRSTKRGAQAYEHRTGPQSPG